MGISVVVPVHNSSGTLDELVTDIRKAIAPSGQELQVMLIDDASADDSWEVIRNLAVAHDEVEGVRLSRNVGGHNAILCGALRARHSTIATIDDDLQQPPSELPTLLEALTPGVDVVYGTAATYEHGLLRRIAAKSTKWVLEHVFRVSGAGTVTSFRVFRSRLTAAFPARPGPLCSIDTILSSTTDRITHVEVEHRARRSGRSQYTLAKLVSHTMNTIVGGSPAPLHFATIVGLLSLAAGLGGFVATIVALAMGRLQTGEGLALVSGFLVVSGTGLVGLGILGEYGARIMLSAGGTPPFFVAETTCDDE